ncbi:MULTISPECIES: hypothetical protein [Pseudomonas]|nr:MULTISPECIES: hypothetical protein [Pseudomonas]
MDNKETFNTVVSLVARQPWVGSKIPEMTHMLYEECKCSRSREMLVNIISGFFYLSLTEYHSKLSDLALEVMAQEHYEDDALIVAMAADSNPDSSHELLYNLKYIFTKAGWNSFTGVSSFGSAYKKYKTTGRKRLVVVDDFVGSGKTVISRCRELNKVFENAEVEGFSVSVKVLVSTRRGLENIRAEGIDVTAQHEISKAIDDSFPDTVAAEYRNLMIELEANLSKAYNDIEMPSMGYNDAQAAYCRENSNTPNSVFPVFWWPFNNDSNKRSTMLHRAMEDA